MLRPLAIFLFGTAGIAFAAIFVRLALPSPPVVTAFWRIALATAVLFAWLLWRRVPVPGWRELRMLLLAGICFGADMALWNSSLVATSVANATLLVNTTPVLVGAFSVWWWSERLKPRFVAGAGVALLGVGLLVHGDAGGTDSLRGDALALGAAFFYAAYLLLVKQVRAGVDAVPAVAWAGLSASLTLFAVAWVRGDAFTGHPPHSWFWFAASAGVSHLGGVLGIVAGLRYLRASFASVALLAQPVGTALLGWWILGEGLGALQAIGGTAVLVGILLASEGGADPATPGTPARPTTGRAAEGPTRPSS